MCKASLRISRYPNILAELLCRQPELHSRGGVHGRLRRRTSTSILYGSTGTPFFDGEYVFNDTLLGLVIVASMHLNILTTHIYICIYIFNALAIILNTIP